MTPKPQWEIEVDVEKEKFKAVLEQFISFVEDESKRIDEYRCGARRRDGGPVITCTLFLKQLLKHTQDESYKQGVEDMRRKCVDAVIEHTEMDLKTTL